MQFREVGRALSARQRYLGARMSWKMLKEGCECLVMCSGGSL